MDSIQGKAVLLTGASRGIGRALALRLAREKAILAICGRDGAALEAVAAEAGALSGAPVLHRGFDLRDDAALAAFYREARGRFGAPHVLISNAGVNPRKAPVWETAVEEFDAAVAVNARAPFVLLREALPDMIARRGGHVVLVLSSACLFANENLGAYTAAKACLKGLADVLRKEARPHGVRVTAVYPGGVDTTFRPARRPDYTSPDSVAEAIVGALTLPPDLVVHDLTFRPMVETNFA